VVPVGQAAQQPPVTARFTPAAATPDAPNIAAPP
jgi:hypothetical protein